MSSLNPIFLPGQKAQKPAAARTKENTTEHRKRQVRSDRIHDLKFPVTPTERSEFRRKAKYNKMTETDFSTMLLKKAIVLYKSHPHIFQEIMYRDTKQYLHCKPTEFHYDDVFQIALNWNSSVRKAVHRMMIYMLRRCEASD